MKLVIGIPTINRADLLIPALLKYEACYPHIEILIVDNGNQNINVGVNNLFIYKQNNNLGVAASWNLLCVKAFYEFQATHLMILNDDVEVVKPKELLLKTIEAHGKNTLLVQNGTWCSFVIPKKVFELVGQFDEQFYPAYFEDNDYHYRIALLDPEVNVVIDDILNPTLYRNSQTIAKEPKLNELFLSNKRRYINKWGGEPGEEKYHKPFGG
jgi:GT2 family glycosyltransferase